MFSGKAHSLTLAMILCSASFVFASEIAPQDGLWRADAKGGQFEQCNLLIEGMLAGNEMLNRKGESRKIAWGGHFDPDAMQIFNGDGAPITWEKTGENSYSGQMFDIESCAGTEANACSRVGADLQMTLTSAKTIDASSTINFASLMGDSTDLEAMGDLGFDKCRVTIKYEIIKIAD